MQSIWINAVLLYCQRGGPTTVGRLPLGYIWLLISLWSAWWTLVTGILRAEHKLDIVCSGWLHRASALLLQQLCASDDSLVLTMAICVCVLD